MSVTALVSHVLMWPYVASPAVASSHHEVTAVRRLGVSNTNGIGVGLKLAVGSRVVVGTPEGADTGTVVGAGVAVGTGVGSSIGTFVGAHVGEWEPPLPENIPSMLTPARFQHST